MDKENLKLIVKNLESLLECLKNEVYSNEGSFIPNYDEVSPYLTDYDEVFYGDEDFDDMSYCDNKLI